MYILICRRVWNTISATSMLQHFRAKTSHTTSLSEDHVKMGKFIFGVQRVLSAMSVSKHLAEVSVTFMRYF